MESLKLATVCLFYSFLFVKWMCAVVWNNRQPSRDADQRVVIQMASFDNLNTLCAQKKCPAKWIRNENHTKTVHLWYQSLYHQQWFSMTIDLLNNDSFYTNGERNGTMTCIWCSMRTIFKRTQRRKNSLLSIYNLHIFMTPITNCGGKKIEKKNTEWELVNHSV